MDIIEIFKILDKDEKKLIGDKLTEKIIKALDNIKQSDIEEVVISEMKSLIRWAFTESDFDLDGFGEVISTKLISMLKELLGEK